MYKKYEILELLVSFCRFVNLQIVRTKNKLLSPAHRFRNYFFVFLLSCEGDKILTVTNVNNRRRLFLIWIRQNFHHLFYKTCTLTHTSNTIHKACARPPDENDTFLNDRPWLFTVNWLFVKMWFKVHRNVNDIRKQIIAFHNETYNQTDKMKLIILYEEIL
jgi:hypothetical protein